MTPGDEVAAFAPTADTTGAVLLSESNHCRSAEIVGGAITLEDAREKYVSANFEV